MQNSTNTTVNQWHNSWWGSTRLVHSIRLIFQKSGKATIIRNLAVPSYFIAYLVFMSSNRVDPAPRNRGPTSLLALKIRTPVANTGKLRSISQVPVSIGRNMPAALSYGVYISQLIQYSIACGSYEDVLDKGLLLTMRLLYQGFILVKLKSLLRKFHGRHHDLVDRCWISVSQMTTDMFHLS